MLHPLGISVSRLRSAQARPSHLRTPQPPGTSVTFRELSLSRDAPTTPSPTSDTRASAFTQSIGCLLCLIYCCVFLVQQLPKPVNGLVAPARKALLSVTDAVLAFFPSVPTSPEARNGLFLFLAAGAIPWLVMLVSGRGRPAELGLRLPNRYGWRILGLGYLIALPFLWWMIGAPDFAARYLDRYERAGAAAFTGYYLINMATEHFLIQGVVLAACRSGRRWPLAIPVEPAKARGYRSVLQWLGMAQTVDASPAGSRATRWLGLPNGCAAAIVTSGVLFALVHFGKHPRELVLALPGGLAQAYIAYRTNTWLVPLVLHLATAATAFGMMLAFR